MLQSVGRSADAATFAVSGGRADFHSMTRRRITAPADPKKHELIKIKDLPNHDGLANLTAAVGYNASSKQSQE